MGVGGEASVVHQDVALWLVLASKGRPVRYSLKHGRRAWLQATRGAATLNGRPFNAGDAAAVVEENTLEITASDHAEILLFDLA